MCKYQVALSMILTDLMQLDEANRLSDEANRLDDNLRHQLGKIHNLHQVRGFSGCLCTGFTLGLYINDR